MKTGHQGRVQAIDVSENMLNKAQANINKYALANIDLHSNYFRRAYGQFCPVLSGGSRTGNPESSEV